MDRAAAFRDGKIAGMEALIEEVSKGHENDNLEFYGGITQIINGRPVPYITIGSLKRAAERVEKEMT